MPLKFNPAEYIEASYLEYARVFVLSFLQRGRQENNVGDLEVSIPTHCAPGYRNCRSFDPIIIQSSRLFRDCNDEPHVGPKLLTFVSSSARTDNMMHSNDTRSGSAGCVNPSPPTDRKPLPFVVTCEYRKTLPFVVTCESYQADHK